MTTLDADGRSPSAITAKRRAVWVRRTAITVAILVLGIARMIGFAAPALRPYWDVPPPQAPTALSPYELLVDLRPVSFTMTVNWNKVRLTSTAEHLASNPMFWRNMHFDDWDRLPADIRHTALSRMTARHRRVAAGPAVWSHLSAADWDLVPQPLRAVLFPRMIEHWANAYGLTAIYHLNPEQVTDTLNAIMMAESWFEHRGINVNQWGNRDLGLGGCSNRCRRILAEMADAGDLDFALSEDDYFNPWHATRALVVWFGLELIRSDGHIDLAVRAYHRGFEAASAGEGHEYLSNVNRLRGLYFAADVESPTWLTLQSWARSLDNRRTSPPAFPLEP